MLNARAVSLRARLALGAGVIGLVAALAAWLALYSMKQMSQRVETALQAEQRIQRYSVLASQVGTYLAIVYEAGQERIAPGISGTRLDGMADDIARTFARIRQDLDEAVGAVEGSGFDERSRRATRSIGIARMQALFNDSAARFREGLSAIDPDRLNGQINAFSLGFDPLLNSAITEERRARDAAIASIAALRQWLSRLAVAVGALAILLVPGFYFGLVRPQMDRLDRLRSAARRIGAADFAVDLPKTRADEIGLLFAEVNRMAEALARRQREVQSESDRLNQTVAERTEALRTANAALAKTDEDRRRFFADISHELRTPLTVILMETELALKSDGPQREHFGVIRNRALRLNRRIDDLLRLARSESGKISLESQPFDLAEAARQALGDMAGLAASAGMTLSLDADAPVMALGDSNWTRQCVTGLLENCLRHARAGGRVRLICDHAESGAQLRVLDNGPGMPAADLSRATRRFAQGRGETRREGFGIGLALVAWIIKEQGGRITLISPAPADLRIGAAPGTLVTVHLPEPAP